MNYAINRSLLLEATRELGYSYANENFDHLTITHKSNRLRFFGLIPDTLTEYNRRIADDKLFMRVLLRKAGVPVPNDYSLQRSVICKALDALENSCTNTLVVKSRRRQSEDSVKRGVSKNRSSVEKAMQELHKRQLAPLMVEEEIVGQDLRFLVVGKHNPRVIHCIERTATTVLGHSQRSLRDLISEQNEHRYKNPVFKEKPIPWPSRVSLDAPTEDGKLIVVSKSNSLGDGGSTHTVDIKSKHGLLPTIMLAHTISELYYSTVDAVLTDNNKLYVIDINPIPNLALHQFPLYGSSVHAGLEVLKALFEDLALERGS